MYLICTFFPILEHCSIYTLNLNISIKYIPKYIHIDVDEPLTELECAATTIDCKLSQRQYKTIARRANRNRRRVFPSYAKVAKYKADRCTPKGIRTPREDTVEVDLQDALDHQMLEMLTPKIIENMKILKEKGATFVLYFKYGKV